MKKRKRILALLLSTAMVLTMGMGAFAAENGDVQTESTGTEAASDAGDSTGTAAANAQTCTITAPNNGHTYVIYQIFTARYETTEDGTEKMSDVKWGQNGKDGTAGSTVDETVLKALEAVNGKSDTEKLAVIQQYVDLTGAAIGEIKDGASYRGTAGYYLIKDKDGTLSEGQNATPFIVQAVGTLTITPKTGDTPDFEKKIKDINDSDSTAYTDWQDSADYDIGDSIPFKLEGTVAGDYDSYDQYYFAFHDVEEKGLSFEGASKVKVYVDDQELTDSSKYQIQTTVSDECSFEVIFPNLKTISSVKAGSKIRVEYYSTLTKDAVLGSRGNVNKAQLEYSNNPSDVQHGTAKTPWDAVIAFTYKVVVNKYANNVLDGNKLAGAEFTLEKKNADNTWKTLALVKSNDGTSFSFSGLDDGQYRLTETKAPQYYNKLVDPIEFKVEAGHTTVWDGENRTQVLTSLTGTKTSGEIGFTFTPDTSDGSLSTNVINKSGATLPETGGIGTTIFYIIGGVLVVGAAVALITKKRMKASENR